MVLVSAGRAAGRIQSRAERGKGQWRTAAREHGLEQELHAVEK